MTPCGAEVGNWGLWALQQFSFLLSFYKLKKTNYFWLCWVSAAAQASLQLPCVGFSCCWAWALGCPGFSTCSTWAQAWLLGSRAQAQQLWCRGSAAPWHVGSSRTRDQTRVSCIGRQILYHWATGEAQFCPFFISYFSVFPALLKNNDKIVVFLKCTVWCTRTLWEVFHCLANEQSPFFAGGWGAVWTP